MNTRGRRTRASRSASVATCVRAPRPRVEARITIEVLLGHFDPGTLRLTPDFVYRHVPTFFESGPRRLPLADRCARRHWATLGGKNGHTITERSIAMARILYRAKTTVTGGRRTVTDTPLTASSTCNCVSRGDRRRGRRREPRQLFAVGPAACSRAARCGRRREHAEVGDVSIDGRVGLLPTEDPRIQARRGARCDTAEGHRPDAAVKIVVTAHQVCPYSTRRAAASTWRSPRTVAPSASGTTKFATATDYTERGDDLPEAFDGTRVGEVRLTIAVCTPAAASARKP